MRKTNNEWKETMPPKKEILGNVLLKELIAIRTDTLWRMLSLLQQDQLPGPNEEGATGKLDNKGAIFIPGGLIYQDVDEKQISYEPLESLNETVFREKIRASMQYDNATLLLPDGLINSLNLDKTASFDGELRGIKAQYLLLSGDRVFNLRGHEGYVIELEVGIKEQAESKA